MKKILSILAAVVLSGMMGATAYAQGYVVRGVVVDQQGPVIGAAIIEAGTTNGAVTDIDGNFSLRLHRLHHAHLQGFRDACHHHPRRGQRVPR